MKKLLNKLLAFSAYFCGFVVAAGFTVYFAVYDSKADFFADLDTGKRWVRLELFNRGYAPKLEEEDFRFLYQKACYRQCHGEEAMITAVLSPAGWIQVVERMRVKENVKITGFEAAVIIQYLAETYPTTRSGFPFKVRKNIHKAVWRNDMGDSDIYTDVIYVTSLYLKSIGAEHLIDEYDLKNYHSFIVSFTVHDGVVDLFDLDKVSFMNSENGTIGTGVPWMLRFQTADKHHFEGVIRFSKKEKAAKGPVVYEGAKWFDLDIRDVGGIEKRSFRWKLPIAYPPEAFSEIEARASTK